MSAGQRPSGPVGPGGPVLLSPEVKQPLRLIRPDHHTLVRSLLLSPVFRLHLSIQEGAPQLNWRTVREQEGLPPKYRDWASRVFMLDLTQFWAYGQIGRCSVTTPVTGTHDAVEAFHAIPGNEHLDHFQVLVGNRTCSAAVATRVPLVTSGPNADAINRQRRARFFEVNADRFPGTVTCRGIEYRVFYRDANDPDRPRARDLVGEACRHLQNLCGVVFLLRTADSDDFRMSERDLFGAAATARHWCLGPEPDPRQIRLPEGLAHLLFDKRTTDCFPFAARLATTHALDEYRARALPMPLLELNAVAHEQEQDPDDLLPFGLELADDLRFAHDLLAPVWRTHRFDLAAALGEIQSLAGVQAPESHQGASAAEEGERMADPEGWSPPRL